MIDQVFLVILIWFIRSAVRRDQIYFLSLNPRRKLRLLTYNSYRRIVFFTISFQKGKPNFENFKKEGGTWKKFGEEEAKMKGNDFQKESAGFGFVAQFYEIAWNTFGDTVNWYVSTP